MEKKKIAVFMDWYLPGTKAGGPVRSVYSLISLLKNDYVFYIITTNKDLGSTESYAAITPDKLTINENINYYYFSNEKINSTNILLLINDVKPDLIYLNSFWSFTFSINIIRLKNKRLINTPLLLAPRGMLGKGALSLKSFKKTIYLISAKIFGWYKNVRFHATNKQEEEDIKLRFSSAKVTIATNLNSGVVMKNHTAKTVNSVNLFFLSRIAEVKNLHFALEVLKDIPAQINVNYDIYGNLEDKNYWARCSELILQLPKNVTVTYKKELAFNDVQKTISNYHCLFLPTLNENFGHSIVESLLCGCPVIISDQTPWINLEKNNVGFAISLSNKVGFLNAVIEMAKLNQQEFSEKSNAANNYISQKIEVEKNINLYKNLFNESIKN